MIDIRAIDLNLLLAFDAIMRNASITKAAMELDLTQSSVSGRLRKLRGLLDDTLFVRGSYGVTPTPYSEALAPYVRDAIETLRRGLAEAQQFEPSRARRTFTVITTDLGEATILSLLCGYLDRAAPNISISAIGLASHEIPLALKGDTADLAVSHLPELESGFYQRALFETDYVCLARANHPRLRDGMSRTVFETVRHVVAESQSSHRFHLLEQHLKASGVKREIGLRVVHVLSIPYIVAATDMIATVPRTFFGPRAAQGLGIVVYEPPIQLPKIDVKLIWHERMNNDSGNRWLRGQIARTATAVNWNRGFTIPGSDDDADMA